MGLMKKCHLHVCFIIKRIKFLNAAYMLFRISYDSKLYTLSPAAYCVMDLMHCSVYSTPYGEETVMTAVLSIIKTPV